MSKSSIIQLKVTVIYPFVLGQFGRQVSRQPSFNKVHNIFQSFFCFPGSGGVSKNIKPPIQEFVDTPAILPSLTEM